MRRVQVVEDEHVPGVVRIFPDPRPRRPFVAIVGAVHGDEPCGLEVLMRLRREAEEGHLRITAGTIVLVHGNPRATSQRARHGDRGVDLNRLFDFSFVDEMPRDGWSYEHHRALSLRPVLEDADALIDLHSASSPTRPFAIVNEVEASYGLAARVGVDYVSHGWLAPGFLGDKTTLGALARRDVPALGVECGQHAAFDTPDVAYRCAMRFLCACGVLGGSEPPPRPVLYLEMFRPVPKPSRGFRFARPWRGLQRLSAGTVLGADHDSPLRLEHDSYVLLPNESVPPGGDMLYLAREHVPFLAEPG